MARTKASVGVKVASGKSSKARCSAPPEPSSSGSSASSGGSRSSGSGNRVCPRETPAWQRPITSFFGGAEHKTPGENGATSSKPKPSNNEETPIQIDDEKATNKELDETIELLPLTGEESHKIEEFFPVTKNGVKENENGIKTNEITTEDKQNGSDEHSKSSSERTSDRKGKGRGKKTKQKENIDTNVEKRKSVKRDLDAVEFEERSPQNIKKLKKN